jgi:hypothetical protein
MQITMQLPCQRCRRLIASGGLPDRAGQPTQIMLHMGLGRLRDLPGADAAEAAWGGPAAAPGDECDASIVPVVSGHVDPDDLDRLAAALLNRTAAHPGPGQPGPGQPGPGQPGPAPHPRRRLTAGRSGQDSGVSEENYATTHWPAIFDLDTYKRLVGAVSDPAVRRHASARLPARLRAEPGASGGFGTASAAARIATRTWKEIEGLTRSNVGCGPRGKAGCKT